MPDEEMEISVDFGQSGFSEDIDIDLDFPIGQHDEDMVLGDYDQLQDMDNFNADTHDEMMGDDDETYGMIDTQDTEHNASAVAANDIDLDLGTTVDPNWQPSTANATFDDDAEIDYLDEEDDVVDIATTDKPAVDENEVSEPVPTHLPVQDSSAAEIPDVQDNTSASSGLKITETDNSRQLNVHDAVDIPNDQHPDTTKASVANPGEGHPVEEPLEAPETGHDNNQSIVGDAEDDAPIDTDDDQARSAGSHRPEQDDGDDFAADLDTLQYQLGDFDDANGEVYDVNDGSLESGTNVEAASQHASSPAVDSEARLTNGTDLKASVPATSSATSSVELLERYGVYISYGETDYSLFASSEDDDPNQYFLSDKTALDLPLSDFLTSLREVVAEEISPLDELVMHVDGLGLEFSQSTTPDFLQRFTFGDLVVLYDKLIKNEEEGSRSDLYTYLLIKPSCQQRLIALYDSANAGRGFSEVAMFRDSPSFIAENEADEEFGALGSDHDSPCGAEETQAGDDEHGDAQNGHDDGEVNDYLDELEAVDDPNSREEDRAALEAAVHEPDTVTAQPETATGLVNQESVVDTTHNGAEVSDDTPEELGSAEGTFPILFAPLSPCSGDDDCPLSGTTPNNLSPITPLKLDANRLIIEDSRKQESTQPKLQSDDGIQQSKTESVVAVEPLTTPKPRAADLPNSENTSVTATLNGDDADEIDYSDGEDEVDHDVVAENKEPEKPLEGADALEVPLDDEITWESENEEAKSTLNVASPKRTGQVSPVSGKRTRSDSDNLTAGEENDVKRLRS
ncbi:hypothetical protein GGR57DRAFT_505995 [Xylariaceae sp. FL1272]|nr:hypothetical protein GGR57DRAFT_505995 [Xylariaceae sp. FL1272]